MRAAVISSLNTVSIVWSVPFVIVLCTSSFIIFPMPRLSVSNSALVTALMKESPCDDVGDAVSSFFLVFRVLRGGRLVVLSARYGKCSVDSGSKEISTILRGCFDLFMFLICEPPVILLLSVNTESHALL
jgi:hypothetical protein